MSDNDKTGLDTSNFNNTNNETTTNKVGEETRRIRSLECEAVDATVTRILFTRLKHDKTGTPNIESIANQLVFEKSNKEGHSWLLENENCLRSERLVVSLLSIKIVESQMKNQKTNYHDN